MQTQPAKFDEPPRLPKKKLPPLIDVALPLVAVGSGAMLGLAVPNIIEGSGAWSIVKASVLALSATVVAFSVNRLAIERGAPQAAKGYLGATIVSIGSVVAVGGGLFAATYSGLVFRDVAELKLQEHGTAVSDHIALQSSATAQTTRVLPAMRSIETDLRHKAECEIETACISGRGGGYGPVARIVEEQAGRAASLGEQIAAGDSDRQAIMARLNGLVAEYQTTLGNDQEDIWNRRAALQTIDARIGQELGALREAMPVALVGAYAGELQGGVTVQGHSEAEGRLNAILVRHGQSLSAVIGSIGASNVSPPAFPPRTGVSDTFAYIGHFLPVAAITAVVELIFPLVLWAYTYWALAWDIHVRDRRSRGLDSDERDRAVSATTPPKTVAPAPAPVATGKNRRDRRGHGRSASRDPKKLNGAAGHDDTSKDARRRDDTGERDNAR